MLQKLLWPFHTEGVILLALPAIAALSLLLRRPGMNASFLRNRRSILRWAGILGLAAAAFFLLADIATIPQQRSFQDDESSVLSVAAAWVHHQPMYPSLDAPVDYGVLYGPATYLLFTLPMLFHAENVMAYQAWVALGLAAMLAFSFVAMRRLARPAVAAAAFGYYVFTVGLKAANQWSNKGDPWILLFLAVAFWAALRLKPRQADVTIALCGAVLIDIKANLFLLALLPFLLVSRPDRKARTTAILAIPGMVLLALVPFLLPGISLSGYGIQLALASRHGLSRSLFLINVMYFVRVFALPFGASLWMLHRGDPERASRYLHRRRSFLLLLAAASLVAVVTGAKNGAGAWHLVPLGLPFALVIAEMWNEAPPLTPANLPLRLAPALWVFGTLAVHGIERTADAIHTRFYNDIPSLNEYDFADVQRDMLQVQADHPGDTLQVGVSGGHEYTLTRLRYLYVMRGQPLFTDPNAQAERDGSHVPFSPAVLHALADCTISLWLIPSSSEPPFSMGGGYASAASGTAGLLTDPHLYPQPWPDIFQQHYHRVVKSRYFDLWACNAAPPPGNPPDRQN
ncbi:hypothetical protein [Terriglobus aquaticus]|uniref:DUF2029 domain-containing protein n=1 Tax=Terriglobus aquaticus TaxID=940139 RepID=A0ABW9KJ47_9BACT|nr:hypothetical protein [Terriglobus aquaticus]